MSEYKFGTWYPSESAPTNRSLLVWIPNAEHYGPPVYRGVLVDMGAGKRWMVSGLHQGRDCGPYERPTYWMPLPPSPAQELTLFPIESTCAEVQKKSTDWPGFDEFWLIYPRKEGRKPALKSWNKEKPDIQEVTKALTWQTQTEQWRKGFIPFPTTYLNQRRWEDERPPETKPEQVYQ